MTKHLNFCALMALVAMGVVFTACTDYSDNPVKPVGIAIDETNFPDPAFRNYLIETYDFAKDGILTDEEIKNTKRLYLGIDSIKSLKGIEYFTDLKKLFCFFNEITELDMSRNTKLTYLDCSNCKITKLNIANNVLLDTLYCENNELTELDISNNTELVYLDCYNNKLTQLDMSRNTKLTYLDCSDCKITKLNIANNVLLDTLYCENNELTELDISNNTELVYLDCYDNKLTQLDVSKNTALAQLDFERNQIASIDLSNNIWLEEMYCSGNGMTQLDVSACQQLELLHCYHNKISGQNMDNLISSLPLNDTPTYFDLAVVDFTEEADKEGNVMTKSQVETTKAKGWKPLQWDDDEFYWVDYPGSE